MEHVPKLLLPLSIYKTNILGGGIWGKPPKWYFESVVLVLEMI